MPSAPIISPLAHGTSGSDSDMFGKLGRGLPPSGISDREHRFGEIPEHQDILVWVMVLGFSAVGVVGVSLIVAGLN